MIHNTFDSFSMLQIMGIAQGSDLKRISIFPQRLPAPSAVKSELFGICIEFFVLAAPSFQRKIFSGCVNSNRLHCGGIQESHRRGLMAQIILQACGGKDLNLDLSPCSPRPPVHFF
jgi:hypothetical protein